MHILYKAKSIMQQSPKLSSLKLLQRKIMMFEVFDTIIEIVILLVFFLSVQYFFFSPFIVSGASMEHSLHDQEIIMVNRIGFSKYLFGHTGSIHRGDVIVFRPPLETTEYYIKRIIGIPGDTIEFKDNAIFLNGAKLSEHYTNCQIDETSPTGSLPCRYSYMSSSPIVVPEDSFFAMGDNRNFSADSRQCFRKIPIQDCVPGSKEMFVPYQNIVGTASFVFWPFNAAASEKKTQTTSFLESFWPLNNPRSIQRLDPALQVNDSKNT